MNKPINNVGPVKQTNKQSHKKLCWSCQVEKLFLTKIIFASWEIISHQDYLGEANVVHSVCEDEEAEKS